MSSVSTRINLTGIFATAVEEEAIAATIKEGKTVSQAEIVRRGLRKAWGENLENRPSCTADEPPVNSSTVQPVNCSDIGADDLFSSPL
jgi:hypothetical protein